MTAQEIKAAVDNGKKVHWANTLYDIKKDKNGEYLIVCNINQHTIGLTWADGVTLNAPEDEFFIGKQGKVSI